MLLFRPLPKPGRPLPAAAEEEEEEDEEEEEEEAVTEDDETEDGDGAVIGDVRRPPLGLRTVAPAGGCCCCCWGFSDMVRGPYTGSHAGRGQPRAERAEETPERGRDAREPSGEARNSAAGGAAELARGIRTTTKGRGGPPRARSCREPGRDSPPLLPLLPKQFEAEGGEHCAEGGGPGPGGGGAAEGYAPGPTPPPRPLRRAVRQSERRPGHLAEVRRRGSRAVAGFR